MKANKRVSEFMEIIISCVLIVFALVGVLYHFGLIYKIPQGVDVQAMRMACKDAGYDNLYDARDEVMGHYICTNNYSSAREFKSYNYFVVAFNDRELQYAENDNRVVLVNGQYVVQTKQVVTEWK